MFAEVSIISHMLLLHIFTSSFKHWLIHASSSLLFKGKQCLWGLMDMRMYLIAPNCRGSNFPRTLSAAFHSSLSLCLRPHFPLAVPSSWLGTEGIQRQARFWKTRDSYEDWLWSRTPRQTILRPHDNLGHFHPTFYSSGSDLHCSLMILPAHQLPPLFV